MFYTAQQGCLNIWAKGFVIVRVSLTVWGFFFRRDKVFALRCYRTLTGMVMVTASFFSFRFKRVCHFVLLSFLSSLNNTLLLIWLHNHSLNLEDLNAF